MSDCLEPLYVVNPLLQKETKRYIWGNDRIASELFVTLCELCIKVEGFICDQYKGTTLWNKPVLALDDIRDFEVILCVSNKISVYEVPEGNYTICQGVMILNPKFDRKQAVIYGAGMVGKQILDFLRTVDVDVLGFIDSNRKVVGNEVSNVLIKDVSYLEQLPDTAYIIEAGKYYKEIDETVKQYIGAGKRFYWEQLDNQVERNPANINVDEGLYMDLQDVLWMQEFFGNKNFYLYGDRKLSQRYRVILDLLGFRADIVSDSTDNVDGKCVEDLLYEENYLILLVGGETKKLVHKMNCLGFQEVENYVWIASPFIWYNLSRRQMLDLNLGYVYLMDNKYPGVKILGNNNDNDYKIAILGGSTTDAECCPVSSWVDFLYGKCRQYNVTIFNGGSDGYNSTMELIKMLRDLLILEPDMIIVYDGVNDSATNYTGLPYNFGYLRRMLLFATAGRDKDSSSEIESAVWGKSWYRRVPKNGSQINAGYFDERDSFDIWVSNIEIMHAVAQSKGISFFSFLQPMLLSKKEASLTLKEKSWINAETIFMSVGTLEGRRSYRKLMKERNIEYTHDYMYDLSDIFDGEDVYLDECHVYEEGNQIIADKIWEKIKNYVIS